MSKLTLMGQIRHIDEKKYISFRTESKEHLLPIVSDVDAAEGEWVHFFGQLRTRSVPDGERHRKIWFGLGDLYPSVEGIYLNELTVSGKVVRVDELRTTPLTLRKIVDFVVVDGLDYYNCIAFGKTADRLIEYKKKGCEIVFTSAQFNSRDYTKDGEQRTAYEVCVRDFV